MNLCIHGKKSSEINFKACWQNKRKLKSNRRIRKNVFTLLASIPLPLESVCSCRSQHTYIYIYICTGEKDLSFEEPLNFFQSSSFCFRNPKIHNHHSTSWNYCINSERSCKNYFKVNRDSWCWIETVCSCPDYICWSFSFFFWGYTRVRKNTCSAPTHKQGCCHCNNPRCQPIEQCCQTSSKAFHVHWKYLHFKFKFMNQIDILV